jgi:hypothetical protein
MQTTRRFAAVYGELGLEAVKRALCRPPLPTCFRVNTLVTTAEVRSHSTRAVCSMLIFSAGSPPAGVRRERTNASSGESSIVSPPPRMRQEDRLAHPTGTPRSNLASPLHLISRLSKP